jgi:hypothetical protein
MFLPCFRNSRWAPEEEDIRVELVTVNEAEIDEMWSFTGDKSRQYWQWWATDHDPGDLWRFIPAHGNIKTRMSFEHYLLHLI